jgi:hypothetical protein
VFRDLSDQIQYARFNGSSWTVQRVKGGFNEDIELVLDGANQPHLFIGGESFAQHVYRTPTGLFATEPIANWTDRLSGPEAIAATMANGRYHVLYATGNKQIFYASQPVPEPALLLLMCVTLSAICAVRWRWAMPLTDAVTRRQLSSTNGP